MTVEQRNAAILQIIEKHTARSTKSKKVAREGLIAEGIYTKSGKLRPEFGGPGKRKKAAA